jgi:hypothetical protein
MLNAEILVKYIFWDTLFYTGNLENCEFVKGQKFVKVLLGIARGL